MEPIPGEILSGLAVEAVKGLVGRWSSRRSAPDPVQAQRLIQTISGRVGPSVLTVLSRLSQKAESNDGEAAVARFLHSPQFRSFARNTAVAMLTLQVNDVRGELAAQLNGMLRWHLKVAPGEAEILTETLLRTLTELCARAADELQELDEREFASVREQANLELLAGRLGGIADQAGIFNRSSIGRLEELTGFVQEYSRLLHAATSEITPASFDSQRRIPISSFYVAPRFHWDRPRLFHMTPEDEDGLVPTEGEVSLEDLASQGYRLVVLGAPGAGKSTLVQRLAYDLTSPPIRPELGDRLPFLVTLRRYEERKRHRALSIVEYLQSAIHEDLQLEVPDSAIEFLMATDRAVVIFDGLDEMLETHRRVEIAHAIEAFSRAYPTASIIVTSRIVGYGEAPLDQTVFKTAHLLPFTPQDVHTYAAAWFALDTQLTPRERAEVTASFISESESVGDLRSNALMLGLLCNVYRGIRSIPRSRAELYEQCAMMLFDRWDASRGIASAKVMRSAARNALQDVALWIFTEYALASGVPEHRLRERITQRWLQRRLEDEEQAADEAAQLVQSWRGRAWVLTDTGLNSANQRLYSFTHQTFLEYFAAFELVRRNPSPRRLWEVLREHISRGEWDMVAQLAFQILDQNYDGAIEELFQLLCADAHHGSAVSVHGRGNLLEFAARYAEAMDLGPKGCREIITACVDLQIFDRADSPLLTALRSLPDPMLAVEAAVGCCLARMEAEDVEIAYNAFVALAAFASPYGQDGLLPMRQWAAEALKDCRGHLNRIPLDNGIFVLALSHDLIDEDRLLSVGLTWLFVAPTPEQPFGPNREPACSRIVAGAVPSPSASELLASIGMRAERAYGRYLASPSATMSTSAVLDFDTPQAVDGPEDRAGSAHFGLAVLACGMHEWDLWPAYRAAYGAATAEIAPLPLIDRLFHSRVVPSAARDMEKMRDALDDGGFTPNQVRFLTAWAENRLSLLAAALKTGTSFLD